MIYLPHLSGAGKSGHYFNTLFSVQVVFIQPDTTGNSML